MWLVVACLVLLPHVPGADPADAQVPSVTPARELSVERTVLVGGEEVVSGSVEQELRDQGFEVDRIAGDDRYETASSVALRYGGSAGVGSLDGDRTALLTTGEGFADALAAGPVAAHARFPAAADPVRPPRRVRRRCAAAAERRADRRRRRCGGRQRRRRRPRRGQPTGLRRDRRAPVTSRTTPGQAWRGETSRHCSTGRPARRRWSLGGRATPRGSRHRLATRGGRDRRDRRGFQGVRPGRGCVSRRSGTVQGHRRHGPQRRGPGCTLIRAAPAPPVMPGPHRVQPSVRPHADGRCPPRPPAGGSRRNGLRRRAC